MLLKIVIFLNVWNEISGVCRLSDIHIEHGQFVYENDGDQNRSTVPRNYVLLFQCDGGYELSEWRSIYCDGKKWNNGPPHCIKVCSEPGFSFHGFRNNGTCCSVGNTLTYSCIEGYRLVGDKEITCLPGGKWSAPRPRCRPPINICPDPPSIANGMIEPFIGLKHGDYYMPFEKIKIVCNKGFVYYGTTNVLSCEKANSQWSAEFGECRDFSECGVILKNRRRTRMVGGKDVTETWPWMAAIYWKTSEMYQDDGEEQVCGGTVIGRKWILTAAQCLRHGENVTSISNVTIKLGITQVDINTTLQQYKVERFVLHPNYKIQGNIDYDIALVKLNREIKYNRYVRPVCLPPKKLPGNSLLYKPNEHAIAIGWGLDHERGKPNKHLQQINQPLQSWYTCLQKSLEYGIKSDQFTRRILCAGDGTGNEDTCDGDSGSPLMQSQMSDEGTVYWTQIGILSFGMTGCARPDTYGYYTHVQKFVSWIESEFNKDKI